MSEELIKRLHHAANGASFDGRAGDAFLMREAAHALSRPAPVQVPEGWKLVPSRCPLCEYQHGHQIGCENNPVDIALRAATPAPATVQVPEGMAVIPTERYEQLLACEDAMVSLVKTGCIPAEIAGRTLLAADKEKK